MYSMARRMQYSSHPPFQLFLKINNDQHSCVCHYFPLLYTALTGTPFVPGTGFGRTGWGVFGTFGDVFPIVYKWRIPSQNAPKGIVTP